MREVVDGIGRGGSCRGGGWGGGWRTTVNRLITALQREVSATHLEAEVLAQVQEGQGRSSSDYNNSATQRVVQGRTLQAPQVSSLLKEIRCDLRPVR